MSPATENYIFTITFIAQQTFIQSFDIIWHKTGAAR